MVGRIISASKLPSPFKYFPDVHVEIFLSPEDSGAGKQLRRTTRIPKTTDPKWEPPELVEFMVQDIEHSKLIVSV